MDCVELVVESHGQVGRCAWGHVGDERSLALVHGVVHVHPALADLHVLEAGLDTAGKGTENQPSHSHSSHFITGALK